MTLLASAIDPLCITDTQNVVYTGTRLHSRFLSVPRTSVRKHLQLQPLCHHVGNIASTHNLCGFCVHVINMLLWL